MRTLAALALTLAACDKDGAPTADSTGSVILPGDPDESWIDSLTDGMKSPPQNAHGGLDLSFDADLRDAVTAYADCGAWMSGCLEERAGDFDACVAASPICQTEAPWDEGDCCPAACQSRYQDAVASGAAPFDAYVDTFAFDRSCFPGLEGGAR